MNYIIKNAKVVTPYSITNDEILVIGNKIAKIGNIYSVPDDTKIIDAQGNFASAGFVDIHVHGGGYASATDGKNSVITMANAHAKSGTTTIVPTMFSVPIPLTLNGAKGVVEAMESNELLATVAGIHFEGPFLSPSQAGAQAKDALITPANTDLSVFDEFIPYTKMFGMAPELDGALDFAKKLSSSGVVVSIAHSDANYDFVEKAVGYGFSDVTHIYSACSTVHRENAFRIAGVVEAGLEMDGLTCQAIADGCHLPFSLLRLIYHCKGADKMYFVTDGLETSASDVKEGSIITQSSGVQTICEDGVMKLLSRQAFAGSIATADRLVRTAIKAGIPFTDAIRMMTDTPARRIGMTQKGRLAEGLDADILIFDENINIKLVMAMGNIINNK